MNITITTVGKASLACLGWLASAWAWAVVEANHAPHEDLIAIKGIGPSTSQKILHARLQRPFTDWADFMQRVRGVGPATAARMSAHGLTVNGQFLEPVAAPLPPPPASPFARPPLPR
jgi:competence protein ComEA